MLGPANIVQSNSGDSGSATVSGWTLTLPNPTEPGNAVIGAACWANGDLGYVPPFAESASGGNSIQGGGTPGEGKLITFGHMSPGGVSSWSASLSGGTSAGCWCIAEVSGIALMEFWYPTDYNSLGNDEGISRGAVNWLGSSVDTGNTGNQNQSGDTLALTAGAMFSEAGVTPPDYSSVADTTAGQPGTWQRIGTGRKTSRVGATNISLDVFVKFTEGEQSVLDATHTWAVAGRNPLALIYAWRAFGVLPQQTRGRAATNSMT